MKFVFIKNAGLYVLGIIFLNIILSYKASAQDADSIIYKGQILHEQNLEGIANVKLMYGGVEFGLSDSMGIFTLYIPVSINYVLVQAQDFKQDTLHLDGANSSQIEFFLTPNNSNILDGINYSARKNSTEISTLGFQKMEIISSKELMKAACCNLSESFETTPSVDVGFTDAVSGYKQIQMLGLTGSHTLFTRENIPDVRGIASITGLTFTPGSFVEGMQLSKGTGSVINGYEGTAGQINVEWTKPFEEKTPTWHFNGYQSNQGRSEGNLVYSSQITEHVSTNVFAHAKSNWMNLDQNKDGFLDQPKGETYIVSNRWFYFSPKNIEIQGGVKYVKMKNKGGALKYFTDKENATNYWNYNQNLDRIEGWAKLGYMNPTKKWQSMGLQLSGVHHKQITNYHNNNYNAKQSSFYANYIYQSIISNTNNIIKGGASFILDSYDEALKVQAYKRNELVPGIFTEYSYIYLTKFNLVAGLRADYHSIFGTFVTPRLHMRYAPTDRSAIRASIGRAQRTANIFAENFAHMASNRNYIINGLSSDNPYGLNPEVAWNMGLNFTQKFKTGFREGTITTDYYYTHFEKQIVVDIEIPTHVRFYNLEGTSFAHSLQVQIDYELIPRFDIRAAYRFYNVKTTYDGDLKDKPLISKHRAFINLAYKTRNNWHFDYTFQIYGPKRLPMHSTNGLEIQPSSFTKSYTVMNAQISKTFIEDVLDVYFGVENIVGNMQKNMILMSENTQSSYFDASLIWGQAMGRNFYLGVRYNIR
jgi:outer membrane receptor for ferrienterochelin and colicins